MSRLLNTIIAVCVLALAPIGISEAQDPVAAPEVLRVGGEYKIESVGKAGENSFRVEFKALTPTGRYDTLRLESDHVHVAVKVGQKLRLSAEILSESGPSAEVSQVVLFIENSHGRVPVWLLSNKAPIGELRGSRYLEMHSPSNDYIVM